MAITIKNHIISNIVISTIMGPSGNGMFPLTLFPAYRKFAQVVRETGLTVLTKSSTYQRHWGNFRPHNPLTWKYIQRVGKDGLLNAYGLTNYGVEVNAGKIASAITENGFDVIPNFYPQFAHRQSQAIAETLKAIEIYTDSLCALLLALELNFSCPNSVEKIRENMRDASACVKAIRQAYPDLCLIAKISIVHPYEFAQELIDAGVDIIHAVNTIPYDLIYRDGPPSPLRDVGGGGVSGGPAFRQAYDYNKGLRQKIPKTPIIMGCGVMDSYDARNYFHIGANAVSLCTVGRLNPEEATKIIERYAA